VVEISSKSDCRSFGFFAMLVVSVDFDVDVLWRLLFSSIYFAEPDGRLRL
jgi:hypothetical protein